MVRVPFSRSCLGRRLTQNASLASADILVLSPASLAPPLGTHLRARRAAAVGSATSSTSARVELEEVADNLARGGTVAVVRWAAQKGLIKVCCDRSRCGVSADFGVIDGFHLATVRLASVTWWSHAHNLPGYID